MSDLTPLEAAESLERKAELFPGMADLLLYAASYLRAIAAGEYKRVVHAHWNYTSRPNEDCMGGSHAVIECSHCKEDYGAEYDHCPSCGAQMDGQHENEE